MVKRYSESYYAQNSERLKLQDILGNSDPFGHTHHLIVYMKIYILRKEHTYS